MNKIKNLRFHAVVITLIFFTFWPGCSSQNRDIVSKNVLRIGTIQQVKSVNILFDHVLDTFTLVSHPPLFTLDSKGKCQGLLVESYTVSEDFTQWTFNIKKNYIWSDGIPVTPEDVTFSLQYISRHVPSRKWMEKALTNSRVSPDGAVVVSFNRPYTRLDIELTSFPVIPRHIWEKIQRPRFYSGSNQYTGCGPFVIRRIDPDSGFILFKKNPFWKGVQPGIDGIEIHMYQNLDVLSLALERGDIDTFYKYAGTYPYYNIQRLLATRKFRIKKDKTYGLTILGFNLKRESLTDVHFRRAITLAIDYREIRKLITLDYGDIPNPGFIPSGMGDVETLPQLKQDLETARKLLTDAGYKDVNRDGVLENSGGETLHLTLLSTPPHHRLCELVAGYLNRLGIGVKVKIVETATWISKKEAYEYDIVLTRTTPWGMLMHAGWGTGYFDSRRTGEGVLHTVSDPVFLKLCDAALTTRDQNRLKEYARSFQAYFARNLPAVALIRQVNVTPYHKAFNNWHREPLFGIFNIPNFLHLKRTGKHE